MKNKHNLENEYRSFVIVQRPSGKLKAYIQSKAPGHISDWRGCNYRLYPVPGQPRRGFNDVKELLAFLSSGPGSPDLSGSGTFFGDSFPHPWSGLSFDKGEWRLGINGIGLSLEGT
jgi:hypothetical protein